MLEIVNVWIGKSNQELSLPVCIWKRCHFTPNNTVLKIALITCFENLPNGFRLLGTFLILSIEILLPAYVYVEYSSIS